jgi:hypothetical protein
MNSAPLSARAARAVPAWRTQRSLAIITFDEDNCDDPHPPQRVPTIMLASSGGMVAGEPGFASTGTHADARNGRFSRPAGAIGPRPARVLARGTTS